MAAILKGAAAPTNALFTAKLASSGLDETDAQLLGMEYVSDCSQLHPSLQKVQGLKIPYLSLDGTLSKSKFYRVRYLSAPTGFGGQVAKPQRYAQEPGSINEVYLPPSINWANIATNIAETILITEGELKAAAACKMGLNCMALGGVNVWQSSKREIPLLEPLPQINWHGRVVVIIFDSDAAINPNVAAAQVSLAKMLLKLGALPRIATLPPAADGSKQGLDDFIVSGGNMTNVLAELKGLELGDRLATFNNQYAYVKDQDVIIELISAQRSKRDAFSNGLTANVNVIEYVPTSNGGTKRVETRASTEWLKWPSRLDVERVTYEPGQDQITNAQEYNTWPGWGCAPKAGNVQPWIDILDLLFGDDDKSRDWFEKWVAYPVQHPGTKLFTSAVLWGPETGTGKSLVGYTIGEIYGKNFGEIGNQELHASFNEWAINKQFILGDEISGSDKRQEADKLKALITQRQLRINMKNLPTYVVPDCINYYFTSNHPDAFFLDDQDRRFFIHRTVPVVRREPEFYRSYMVWLKGEGREALFDYLLNLDTTGFDPAAPAPSTASKLELVDHARSDLSSWVAYFMTNMDMELERLAEYLHTKSSNLDLVLNTHLKWLYDPQNSSRVTANGLGRELSRFGFKTVGPVESDSFGKRRFYVLRNYPKWAAADPVAVTEHLNKTYPPAINAAKF